MIKEGSHPACWAPEQLVFRSGDEQIHKMIRAAFVDPPTGKPVEFSPVAPELRGSIRRVNLPPGRKLVAITFDLCEEPDEIAGYQGGIVDFLRAHNIKATFFAGGKWMLTHEERTQQLMADPLFEVANHTWEHRNLRLLTGSALTDEIGRAQLAYERVHSDLKARQCLMRDGSNLADVHAPKRLSLFRFPFGACTAEALNAVNDMGLLAIQWDVAAGDPAFGQTADMIVRGVMSHVRPGSIIIFHANGRGYHTQEALPRIIEALQAQGYSFVTVSELLRAGKPVIAQTCYDYKLGDSDRYDDLARRLELRYQKARERVFSAKPNAGEANDPSVQMR